MAMSEAERKRANREKTRRYRERKAAAARAAAEVTGDTGDGDAVTMAPTTMRDAVASALAAMKWLVESDDGAVAQARLLAEDVDVLRHAGETTKSLSAQRALTTVLDRLGGTPTMRMHQELRSRRGGDQPEVPDDDDEAPTGDNVSKFQRPAGRRQA